MYTVFSIHCFSKMAEDIGCCGYCAKFFLILINIFYLVVGLVAALLGIVLLIFNGYVEHFTGWQFVAIGIVICAIGIGIIVMAIVGIVGTAINNWGLLCCHSVFLILVTGLLLVGSVMLYINKSSLENKMAKNFQIYVKNYTKEGSPNYNFITNAVVDAVQAIFHCCGYNGPLDWPLYHLTDTLKGGFPISCQCSIYPEQSNSDCFAFRFDQLSFSTWTKGCNVTIYEKFDAIMIGIGGAGIILSLFKLLYVAISCCFCCCLIDARRNRGDFAYSPLKYSSRPVVNDYGAATGQDASSSQYYYY